MIRTQYKIRNLQVMVDRLDKFNYVGLCLLLIEIILERNIKTFSIIITTTIIIVDVVFNY
jgi:hypothetical protein